MRDIMGYKYPTKQEHIYSIHAATTIGYICPMEMSFKEALEHAMRVSKRGKSKRNVAILAGISPDIMKNISQNKSRTPNAEAATKVADFFGVSLSDFYAGNIPEDIGEDATEIAEDAAKVSGVVRGLSKESREKVQAFAEALRQTEEAARRSE
ncbi:hypothetical protein SAMN04489859_100898 [Paracoccus alcaliphilus]|uniref:HTH cro/C1-type domain-containing protein n=1 Tax=Paracoccus alcaliphilus TaxID=34002 RepID=A0A1H8H3H9_9RHOB|nr:helix-turn-helix transcriptional regulator [Paracoccus alcaliphilus]WCR17396.1 helix-turn-helix transcriptional regulator [Paracoccus alcaliphilus]SEN50685.1 hypothetical protein SAMN04489859_100898 [Paracoccus alcaliphilus]